MNRRRVFLAVAILVSLVVAGWYTVSTFYRLELIRWTLDAGLPGWMLAVIWGW